jgi:hypothetical protein
MEIKKGDFFFFFLSSSNFMRHRSNIPTLLQKFVKFGVNLTFFAPWLPWQRPPFWNPKSLQIGAFGSW